MSHESKGYKFVLFMSGALKMQRKVNPTDKEKKWEEK
jgi:hypothetical protein